MIRFSAGDWDCGSDTLAGEVAALDPGSYVGERRHVDEVDETTLLRVHVYVWSGDAWRAPDEVDKEQPPTPRDRWGDAIVDAFQRPSPDEGNEEET